jgi:site-specific DNA-cytosine methylase
MTHRKMKVLVACEYSGRVREAFRALGHDATSCDLFEDAEDDSPHHIKGDALAVASGGGYDMMIAHPPCTHLAVSGARHFAEKRADGRQQEAVEFFFALARLPIQRIAIENPVCIMSSVWRRPDQVIQPWQFGHGETKATCLWLKGLPHLEPTKIVAGREPRTHRLPPGPNRWKERSRTFQGIADAMAAQWGSLRQLEIEA